MEAKRTPLGDKPPAILNIKENLEIVALSFFNKELIKLPSTSVWPVTQKGCKVEGVKVFIVEEAKQTPGLLPLKQKAVEYNLL